MSAEPKHTFAALYWVSISLVQNLRNLSGCRLSHSCQIRSPSGCRLPHSYRIMPFAPPPVHAGAGLGAIWVPQTLRVMKPHNVHTSSKLANTNENLRRGPFSQQVPGEPLPGPSPLGLCFPRSAFRREPGCHRGRLRAALPGGPASAAPTTGQRPLETGRPEVPRACMVSKEGQRAAWAQRSRVCT